MTSVGLETQQSPQVQVSSTQDRKHVTAVSPRNEATEKTKEQPRPSSVQDQVTLSKEAQALSVSDSQTSKNSTFQQSPSPFDK